MNAPFGKKELKKKSENLSDWYTDVILKAGKELAPHQLCTYLYEVCQLFNNFYNVHSVLKATQDEDKHARLLLTAATAQIIKNGLNIIGIETIEKM